MEEDEFYQMLVKRNSKNSSGNAEHIEAGITDTIVAPKNAKQRKDRAPDKQTLKNFGSLSCIKARVMRISNLNCV